MKIYNWDTMKFEEGDSKMIALAASAAAYAVETEGGVIPDTLDEVSEGAAFRIPLLIPEEIESGDGRKMEKDALSLRDLPIPLLWQITTGDGHNGSVIVGRIDTVERVDNGLGDATGVFDTGPYGREAQRLVDAKMLRGVSADLDKFEATVDGEEMSGDDFNDAMNKIQSEKITVNKARVMAATLVPKPAFQECTIELVTSDPLEENTMPDGIYEETPPLGDDADFALSALAASAAPVSPPNSWFDDPCLTDPTPLTIDDDGRVYGHIATWDTDHIGNFGVKPPRSRSNYAYFRTGLLRTEEGSDVAVGQLTLAGGHAGLDVDARRAVEHYDNTASAVADVACGEDACGIWVAGSLRPGVTPEQVRTLRASAPSGDWRPINNTLELVAVCQVNVPGFPIARARVASGSVTALVAAGAGTLYRLRNSEMEQLTTRVNQLERMILEQKKAEFTARIDEAREFRLNQLRAAAAAAREKLAPELEARAALAQRADEIRAQFKLNVAPDFKEELHPRDDEGKFRKVLGRLTDILNGPDDVPGADEAKQALERAADLEDSGDMEGAKAAAGEAADKIENAASEADRAEPAEAPGVDAPEGRGDRGRDGAKARLGDRLHEIAEDIADAAGEAAGEAGEAIGKAVEDSANSEVPEEFRELLEHIVDEIGEGVDPRTIVSRMDNKLRQWLEGKGFQSPEDLIKVIEKLLQRPIQPGITQ